MSREAADDKLAPPRQASARLKRPATAAGRAKEQSFASYLKALDMPGYIGGLHHS
jgi:hypothetical protein